jgi:hypothetical protein
MTCRTCLAHVPVRQQYSAGAVTKWLSDHNIVGTETRGTLANAQLFPETLIQDRVIARMEFASLELIGIVEALLAGPSKRK